MAAPVTVNIPTALSVSSGTGVAVRKDQYWLSESIPCREACPAGTDVPEYLAAIYQGNFDLAYRINLRDNVFPAVLGRVCSRPCEALCRHGEPGLGDSVSICSLKRAASSFDSRGPVTLDPVASITGKRVAIIGGGPAGLTVARNLTLLGHRCTVFEKHWRPGGMMVQGIPEFRLPRAIVEREIEQVRLQGVEIICNTEIGSCLPLAALLRDFDAVVMAAGTYRPNIPDFAAVELGGISHGLPWLISANESCNSATVGDSCIVIGGGFTAIDCARMAWRLQCKRVSPERARVRVCYRRSPDEMLIPTNEISELGNESIAMEFLAIPKRCVGNGGGVQGVEFVRARLGAPDANGRKMPEELMGSAFLHEADTVLLATGQYPQTDWIDLHLRSLLLAKDMRLRSGRNCTTALPKLFVAGDFALGASTLIDAIGHAKRAASVVDQFLMGESRLIDALEVEDGRRVTRSRSMNDIPRIEVPTLPVGRRTLDAEVETGLERGQAVAESSRCYFCNFKYEIDVSRCIKCDKCVEVMPRPNCIVRVLRVNADADGIVAGYEESPGFSYDAEYFINQKLCIRCNACLEVCPTECISVQKVSASVWVKGGSPCGAENGPLSCQTD